MYLDDLIEYLLFFREKYGGDMKVLNVELDDKASDGAKISKLSIGLGADVDNLNNQVILIGALSTIKELSVNNSSGIDH